MRNKRLGLSLLRHTGSLLISSGTRVSFLNDPPLTTAIFNHVTCQVEEEDGTKHFLINPYGLRYDEVTASSLLKIDLDGNIVHPGVVGDLFGVNRYYLSIHKTDRGY